MIAPTLAELAALQGDKDLFLPAPLGEGAFAEVTETMRLLGAAAMRLRHSRACLENARVPFDVSALSCALTALEAAYMSMHPVVLAHLDAVGILRGGKNGL